VDLNVNEGGTAEKLRPLSGVFFVKKNGYCTAGAVQAAESRKHKVSLIYLALPDKLADSFRADFASKLRSILLISNRKKGVIYG